MEQDRSISVNGREVDVNDWNATTQEASRSQDYVLAELFRMAPMSGAVSSPAKGVIPYAFYGANGVDATQAGIVTPTGTPSPSLLVAPFRALIGSRSPVPDASPLEAWRDVRSVIVADVNAGAPFAHQVTVPATVADNRCDLIAVRVTLSDPVETDTRYVRDPDTGEITHPTLVVRADDTATIVRIGGDEASTPPLPSLPSDSPGVFFIPLAYVFIPFPGSGADITANRIMEVAPVIPLSRATGAATLSPANKHHDPGGAFLTATPFNVTGIPRRPQTYLPPTMVGQESKFFLFRWDGTPKSPPVNTTVVIDDSVDWRYRIFKWHAYAAHNSGAAVAAWAGGPSDTNVPSAFPPAFALGANTQIGMGQSFQADLAPGFGIAGGCAVCVLQSTSLTAVSNNVVIYVDQADGQLKLSTTADPGAVVFIWLDATGPYANR